MMDNRETKSVVRRLRVAICAVLTVDMTDTPDWEAYQSALKVGLDHLHSQIPPTRCPSMTVHGQDRNIWERLALVAAVPTSLCNRLLPCQHKIGFEGLEAAYADADTRGLKAPFELTNYWYHDLMCGRPITASILEIWNENRFSTPEIRQALGIMYAAYDENRLSSSVLYDAIDGQPELVADLLRGCYLSMRHASAIGIVEEVETTGSNGLVLCSALIIQALDKFNELERNELALSPEDADCLKRISQMIEQSAAGDADNPRA